MATIPNRLSQFWQELKRRNVTRVLAVSIAIAFMILELVDIIREPFGLPEWTLKVTFLILLAGLIITVILAWIYDIHPEGGMAKTEPIDKVKVEDRPKSSNSWKVASYFSFVVIVGLIILNVIPRGGKKEVLDKSIAVLPFINLSTDEENTYFIDAVMGSILDNLYKIEDLRVPGSTSVIQYRENPKPIPIVAEEMDVAYVLEGSGQKIGNRLLLTVKLIIGKEDRLIWSKPYDRVIEKVEDLFDLQKEIAELVAREIEAIITPEEKGLMEEIPTSNLLAYNLYRKGIYEHRKYTISGNNKSIEHFENAIALDSNFALAYTGLARCHIARAAPYVAELSTFEAFALVKPLVDKALSIDPNLDEAHTWNGFYLLYNKWDFVGAEQEYKRAIINDNPDALTVYADLLNFLCRHEEALTICERMTELNPLFPNDRMALTLYYLSEYQKAIEYAKSRIELFNNYNSYDNYGFILLNTGKYEFAIQSFNKAIDVNSSRSTRMLGWMGAAFARMGEVDKSMELVEELKAIREISAGGSPAFFIAVIYAAVENKALALEWLQDAYENHEMEMPWLQTEPQFYALHDEPAFQVLLNKIGFKND